MSHLDCLLAYHQLGTVSSHQSDREVVILNEVKDLIGRPTKRKILRKKAQNDMTKAAKPPPTPYIPLLRIATRYGSSTSEGVRIDYPLSNREYHPIYCGYAHYFIRGLCQNQMGEGGGRHPPYRWIAMVSLKGGFGELHPKSWTINPTTEVQFL